MDIKPADRLNLVQEYYFSRKLKEVARLNSEGRDIISLAIGSPDMPPSQQTIDKLAEVASQPSSHGWHVRVVGPHKFYSFEVHLFQSVEVRLPSVVFREVIIDDLLSEYLAQRGVSGIAWIWHQHLVARIAEGESDVEYAFF